MMNATLPLTLARAMACMAPPQSSVFQSIKVGVQELSLSRFEKMSLNWGGVDLMFAVDIELGQAETATDPGFSPCVIVSRVCINGQWPDAQDFFGATGFAKIVELLNLQLLESA